MRPTVFILLCHLITTAYALTRPCGVLYDLPESIIIQNGYIKCYDEPYATPTTSNALLLCSGSTVFVGAKSSASATTFAIGAFGYSSVVFFPTNSVTTAYYDTVGGAYWYRFPGYSFGFADSSTVTLIPCDHVQDSPDCLSRLCWYLDLNVNHGGYRAGCTVNLHYDSSWRKVIYVTNANYQCGPAPVIDQCLPNGGKGTCPQVCVSSPGSFTCSCYNCTNGLCMNGSCWCVSTYTGENCSQPVFSGFEINSCVNGGYCDASVRDRCTCVCPQSTRGDYCENANDLCPLNSSAALALSTVIVRRRYLGASSLVPAKSCAEIKSVRREVVTGVYWTLNASGLVQLEFCQY